MEPLLDLYYIMLYESEQWSFKDHAISEQQMLPDYPSLNTCTYFCQAVRQGTFVWFLTTCTLVPEKKNKYKALV